MAEGIGMSKSDTSIDQVESTTQVACIRYKIGGKNVKSYIGTSSSRRQFFF